MLKVGPGLFRLILAVLVVVEHLSRFQVGKVAVMVFFILSGYWVTKVYLQKYANLSAGVKAFYISRILRIWPLYFVAACTAMLIARFTSDAPITELYLALPIFGVATHGVDLINVSWSLDIELQFYLMLPPFLFLLGRIQPENRNTKLLLILAALTAGGLILGRVYDIHTVLIYLPLFAMGAFLHISELTVSKRVANWSIISFLVFAIAIYTNESTQQYLINGSTSEINDKLFSLTWAVFLIGFVAFNVRQTSGPMDRHLGNLSYAVYLFHFPFISLTRHILGRDLILGEKFVFLIAILAVCSLIYLVIDSRLERVRSAINRRVAK